MVILNRFKMAENRDIDLKNPFILTRNVYILIIHINNYHYPGTTCVITIFCHFFFQISRFYAPSAVFVLILDPDGKVIMQVVPGEW